MKYFHKILKDDLKQSIFLDLDIFENYEKINSYENFINYITIN
jgi:hypothetical protein